MTLDRRMRQAAESVRRYADAEVDPVAMLWRLRRHQRRRSLRTAAVALAVLAVLAAAAVLVARMPRQPEVIAPPPRPLGRVAATIALPQRDAARLDSRTGTATPIHLGGAPVGAACGAGSCWVGVDDATLARIDPARGRVVASVRLDGQRLPGAVAAGEGAVFAAGLLQRVDPASNQVVHTLAVGPRPSTAAGSPSGPARSGSATPPPAP